MLDLLHCCQSLSEPVTLIARLRLDAALYAPAPARQPGQNGRPALKGARRPPLKALLEQLQDTDQPQVTWASTTVAWYDGATRTVELTSQTAVWYRSGKPPALIRWVLIRDPRAPSSPRPCCAPTQRRTSADPGMVCAALAIGSYLPGGADPSGRGDPAPVVGLGHHPHHAGPLLGLFSWTTLAAHALQQERPIAQRTAAWYDKPSPTFVDAIALVRRHLWLASEGFALSAADPDVRKLPPTCTTEWWIPSLTPLELRKV